MVYINFDNQILLRKHPNNIIYKTEYVQADTVHTWQIKNKYNDTTLF